MRNTVITGKQSMEQTSHERLYKEFIAPVDTTVYVHTEHYWSTVLRNLWLMAKKYNYCPQI